MIDKHNITAQTEPLGVFTTFDDWVNKASSWLGGFPKDKFLVVCFDKEGYLCNIGADFMAARDNDRFPVTAYLLQLSRNAPVIPYRPWAKQVIEEMKHYPLFKEVSLSETALKHLWSIGNTPIEALNDLSTVS